MSTLKVNDIEEATSGGGKIWPSRAWVSFNGTGTISIHSDGNVSSLTDNQTGDYTANYANNLGGTPAGTHGYTGEISTYHTVGFVYGNTSSYFRVDHYNITNSANRVDKGYVSYHVVSIS